VTAYKGLTKEKEALEASLKVLASEKSPKSSSEKSAADQKQLKTLSESLSVLTAEKSRMEANFQADKKKLRAELEAVFINKLFQGSKILIYQLNYLIF
jgi:GRIP and coiled-coil domain-containing protein 1